MELPMPNSSMLVFPSRTAPQARSRATAVASKGGTYCSRARDPALVRTPAVQMLSFIASGTPARAPRFSVPCRAMWASRAAA